MRAQIIDTKHAIGKTLCSPICQANGKKILAKGHVIDADDAIMLQAEGLQRVWVAVLEEGEIGEDEATLKLADEIGCGCIEIRPAAAGRTNLFASETCCMLVDDSLLKHINTGGSFALATSRNFSFALAGQRIATVKSTPFAVSARELDAALSILKERGPILQARPIRNPAVGVLYTDQNNADRPRDLFESCMRQRLYRLGATDVALSSIEQADAIARGLERLLRASPTCILIASTTAPAGPDDEVGRGMTKAGCSIERFLAPVEPGTLLLLGYQGDVPVVSAPGCFRSAKPNVLDLILPPMLARYRVCGWEIASLGHGGLLA